MSRMILKHIITGIIGLLVFACTESKPEDNEISILDGKHVLTINTQTFQVKFGNSENHTLVPYAADSGLFLDGAPIVSVSEEKSKAREEKVFKVISSEGEKALVKVHFRNGVSKFTVIPKSEKYMTISMRVGGMPVAHGLGDAGSYEEDFNLVANKKDTYNIINNGGSNRWVSSFAIFPQNGVAGVFFDHGKKMVIINDHEYSMNISKQGKATFYYFLGTPHEIYDSYKKIRHSEGYQDVKPKFRLFELGWESWDALGWNTNQNTVRKILEKFHKNDYPIRWAVTGSGFWDQGGTTTSFGRWGEKFSEASAFKSWMHSQDIKWMIGLRTNFIPEGGPYYPKTKKRDKNLKVDSFYGNKLTSEAKEKGYLVLDDKGSVFEITSGIFPIVPSNLLNGDAPGAAQWYQQQYELWSVDGIKEDTMMNLDSLTNIYNAPIKEIAEKDGLVMARNGEFTAPGTLLRINDTGVGNISQRLPINYFQYAASGFPNVYSDVAGVHNMHNESQVDKNIRHTWLLSLTSGMAVGAYPEKWSIEKQKIFKKGIDFHYQIAPYMYSAALEGYTTGYPTTLTPLTIAFPEDKQVANLENFQWMIGESVLATPLLKNHTTGKMDVYLPDGIWCDYETGKKYQGPLTLNNYELPLSKVPCFIGGKGFIVLRESDDQPLQAHVYPISEEETNVVFTHPDGASESKIRYQKWRNQSDVEVIDLTTNKAVTFSKDQKSESINFSIEKNHNYLVKEKE